MEMFFIAFPMLSPANGDTFRVPDGPAARSRAPGSLGRPECGVLFKVVMDTIGKRTFTFYGSPHTTVT